MVNAEVETNGAAHQSTQRSILDMFKPIPKKSTVDVGQKWGPPKHIVVTPNHR